MSDFQGYRLPEELTLLQAQIRRFVREEIIPAEQAIDPDAADLPDAVYDRLSAKTKAADLWCLGAPKEYGGGGLNTFSLSIALEEMAQHRMGLYNPGCGTFGRYPPNPIYAGTPETNSKICRAHAEKRPVHLLCDHRTKRRLGPGWGNSNPCRA